MADRSLGGLRYARRISLGGWLQEQLFERRIVLVMGQLDDGAAAKAAAALLALDASGERPIDLHLDSPDGALGAAFVLIDTAEILRSALRVLCRGQVDGPAIGVVAAADHSAATPHARFHLSQPTARLSGTLEEISAQSRQQQELLWKLYGRLTRRTGRPAEEIAEDGGADLISTREKRSTTASSTRSPPPGSCRGMPREGFQMKKVVAPFQQHHPNKQVIFAGHGPAPQLRLHSRGRPRLRRPGVI